MRRYLVFVILGLLVFGCTAGNSPQPSAPPQPAGNATPPSAPPSVTPPTAATPPSTQPAAPPPALPGINPYSGKTLEEIAASGDSVQCDITFIYQNKPAQARFYMKGTGEMRYEETASGVSQCAKTITVIRDTRKYVGCENKTIFPGCYWFRSDHPGGLPDQFRGLPASSVSCASWAYDAAKFQTPGQSCSMS